MREEIEKYLEEGRRRNVLCKKYDEMLYGADTVREFFDAATGVQGIAFVCGSVRDGWFLPPSVVFKTFGRVINGQYTHQGPGYTSKMYYRYKGSVLADTTAICVIESNIGIKVPRNRNVRIYAAGECRIRIIGEGGAKLVFFGDESGLSLECENKLVEKKYVASGGEE